MPNISIIVPVYNSEKYLDKCINSILNQSYKNFELLLINDGSKDKSLDILKAYEKKDSRIHVYDQKNQGIAKTRNRGISLAKGDYIAFIDNDDFLDKDYLTKLYLENKGEDVILGGYYRISEEGKILTSFVLKNTPWAKYTFITPWARLYKRQFLLKNKILFLSSPIGEDIYFNLNAYQKAKKIKILPYQGYYWFYNTKSVSNTIHKGFDKKIDILSFLDTLYETRTKDSNFFDYFCYRFGIWYLMYSGKTAKKEEFLKEYQKIESWNKQHSIHMNIFPLSKKLSGEKLQFRLIVLFFTILKKIHAVRLFAYFYCKGD